MGDKIKGKVTLVTGAAKGIGREIAKEMAKNGSDIIIHYNLSHDNACELRDEILSYGVRCQIFKADFLNVGEIELMFQMIQQQFNKLDFLVNNAGVLQKKHLISVMEEDWDQLIDVNLKGTYFCSKLAGRMMMRCKSGCILFISSTIVNKSLPLQSTYSTSKAGLLGLTLSLAKELAPFKIRVNAILPGPVMTDMNNLNEKERVELIEALPLKKVVECTDIAKLAAFLLSDNSKAITGQAISVDAGLCL